VTDWKEQAVIYSGDYWSWNLYNPAQPAIFGGWNTYWAGWSVFIGPFEEEPHEYGEIVEEVV